MVNTEDFIKRLEIILDYYTLNASSFADKINVQRSSLSHLLSGRNKPSLDFILKIIEVFPEVDLYWILNGKGTFPKTVENVPQKSNVKKEYSKPDPTPLSMPVIPENLFSEIIMNPNLNVDSKKSDSLELPIQSESNEIEKIVFFYKNGTFKIFDPNKP